MTAIIHQLEQQRFSVSLGGHEAVLEYRKLPDDSVDFYRTYVPEEYRGQGVAEKLVQEGLSWARARGLTIQASCWFVRSFL